MRIKTLTESTQQTHPQQHKSRPNQVPDRLTERLEAPPEPASHPLDEDESARTGRRRARFLEEDSQSMATKTRTAKGKTQKKTDALTNQRKKYKTKNGEKKIRRTTRQQRREAHTSQTDGKTTSNQRRKRQHNTISHDGDSAKLPDPTNSHQTNLSEARMGSGRAAVSARVWGDWRRRWLAAMERLARV